MDAETSINRPGLSLFWRTALWGTFAVLLALPAIAMQFTDEVNWGPEDFLFAAVMFGMTGLELTARARFSRIGKLLAAGAIVFALLVIWAELAVGLFD